MAMFLENATRKTNKPKQEALLNYISGHDNGIDPKLLKMGKTIRSRRKWTTKQSIVKQTVSAIDTTEMSPIDKEYLRELIYHVTKKSREHKNVTSPSFAAINSRASALDYIEDTLFEATLRPTKTYQTDNFNARFAEALRSEAEKGAKNKLSILTNAYENARHEIPMRKSLLNIGKEITSRRRWDNRLAKIDELLEDAENAGGLNDHERLYVSTAIQHISNNKTIKGNALLKDWAGSIKRRLAALAGEKYSAYHRQNEALVIVDEKLKQLSDEEDVIAASETTEKIFKAYGYLKESTSRKAPINEIRPLERRCKSIEKKLIQITETSFLYLIEEKEKQQPSEAPLGYVIPSPHAPGASYKPRRLNPFMSAAMALLFGISLSNGTRAPANENVAFNGNPTSEGLIESLYSAPPIRPPEPPEETDNQFCRRSLLKKAEEAKIVLFSDRHLEEVLQRCFTNTAKTPRTIETAKGKILSFSPLGDTPYKIVSPFNRQRKEEPFLVDEESGMVICNPCSEQRADENGIQACYRRHLGVDIAAANGEKKRIQIYPIMPGRIISLGKGGEKAGTYAVVEHNLPDGTMIQTKYLHLDQFSTELESIYEAKTRKKILVARFAQGEGPVVMPYEMGGNEIGVMGATGNALGAHLHLEVKQGKKLVDPEQYLPRYIREDPEHLVVPATPEQKNTLAMLDKAA